jgi:nitric oxide dioxygenase
MFAAHPELKNLFNSGNQASGAQQNSLASAVLAYAANIDNPAALAPVLARIAHKHASVGIEPAQHTIVGHHLLGAIKDVLGAAATPELLAAWDEAYWLLASQLIAAEARLYERAQVEPGAFAELVVKQVIRESGTVTSYYLERPEGGSPGPFKPGQYVSVMLDLPGESRRQIRQHSLSDAPERPYWRITIKRELAEGSSPAGCVSNLLHEQIAAGRTLRVGAAFGDFTPAAASPRPLVLLSAGVGITPMIAALNSLAFARSERPVLFAHAARSQADHVLRPDLERAFDTLPGLRAALFYEDARDAQPVGRSQLAPGTMSLTPAMLDAFHAADFFLCGPLAFMREQWTFLLAAGIPVTQLRREVFGPELLDHLL